MATGQTALIVRPNPTKIDSLIIDCSVTESHGRESETTDHPVEEGFNITDHVRPKPDMVTIEGIVTDTPLSTEQQVRVINGHNVPVNTSTAPQGDPGRSKNALTFLEKLRIGQLITVATGIKVYESMQITSLTVPRDKGTIASLKFTVICKQVRVVLNQQTRVRTSKTPAKVSTGSQVTKESSAGYDFAKSLDGSSNQTLHGIGAAALKR